MDILLTDSRPNLSGVSSRTVSFSWTVMIKGCKREMVHLVDLVNYGYTFLSLVDPVIMLALANFSFLAY